MPFRNEKREIFSNDHKLYSNYLKDKNLNLVRHYGKMTLNTLTEEELADLTILDHIWKTGDKFYKLAAKYYGDTRYWWVIAFFNKKPMDNFCTPGEIINIPTPIEEVVYYIGKK